jgi:hypothetical protein
VTHIRLTISVHGSDLEVYSALQSKLDKRDSFKRDRLKREIAYKREVCRAFRFVSQAECATVSGVIL